MDGDFEPNYDALIVGGGPAGLSAALVLGRACRRVAVIDAGRPRNAAATRLNGFLGRDGTTPLELLQDGRRDAARYGVEFLLATAIDARPLSQDEAAPFPTRFRIVTDDGRTTVGRKLLFASGVVDDLPDLPGLAAGYGVSVHHCPFCDGWEYRGRSILAFAVEPSQAVGLGLLLRGWSDRVTVVTDGRSLEPRDLDRLAENGVASEPAPIGRLVLDGRRLVGVEFTDGRRLEADALFFNTAPHCGCDLPSSLGCQPVERTYATDCKQKTNVPGVFLAGDADGDVQFAIVAAAEGATAAVALHRELQDEERQWNARHSPERRISSTPPDLRPAPDLCPAPGGAVAEIPGQPALGQ